MTGVTKKLFMCQMFMCLFRPLEAFFARSFTVRSFFLIEFFRGRPRGGDNFTSFPKCSEPFIQSVKSTLSDLKSCNPVGGTPSSTA